METTQSKTEILRQMQIIQEDVEKHKLEVEKLLQIIDNLTIKYYTLAEFIKQN